MKQNLKNVMIAVGLVCTALTGQAQTSKAHSAQIVSRVHYLSMPLISVKSRGMIISQLFARRLMNRGLR